MLEIGTVVQDRFLIEERIGVGGMGAVYLATDQKFGSRVAIKQTIYDNPELAHAFEREARLLNSLHHPVLPHVSDFLTENGQLLLVMEFIEGEDLSELLKRGEKLPIDSVVRWTFELLDALDYLHSQDPPIIHRDIKPNNLKLTPRGNIVLLDFGLAKETSGSTIGMRSVFGYSRRYSPLEQIEGTGTDTRSDIFSLGATIFHLLTGEPPIDVLARASAIVAGRPDPLKLASELNPQVPMEFAALIKAAMSLNADDRFATAAAMRTAMEQSMGSELMPADESSEPVAVTQPLTAAIESAPIPEAVVRKPVPRRWVPPTPAVARTAAAAAVSAAAAGRVKFRQYRNRSLRTAAFVSILLLALAGLSFGIYKSISPARVQTEQSLDTAPSVTESALVDGTVDIVQDAPEYQLAGDRRDVPPSEPVAESTKTKAEKVSKTDTVPVKKPAEPQPAPVAKDPEPERPRIVRTPRRDASYSDQPPIVTIERIFTGKVPGGGDWRRDEMSEEEWQRRRQIRKLKRKGQWPPY